MRYYGYSEFLADMKILCKKVEPLKPDAIIAVARGGLSIGQFLAEYLDLRALYTINSVHYDDEQKLESIKLFNIPELGEAKNVLIVDDIVDSGDTMNEVVRTLKNRYPLINFKVGSLFQKKTATMRADFFVQESDEWIDFFWIRDIKK